MQTIHFIGIAGSGMLPLAELLLKKGYPVTGSDRMVSDPQKMETLASPIQIRLQRLLNLGARFFPQDGSGITENTQRVVISTAIEETNPDLQKAQSLKLPILHRTEELKFQLENKRLLAVAGTSGKSTTTALCAWLLQDLQNLACFVGGAEILDTNPNGFNHSSVHVAKGLWSCVELDESDASLLRFEPDIAVILNIGRDHHEYEENLQLFKKFSENVKNNLILNQSDFGCVQLAKELGWAERIVWFFPPAPDEITMTENGSSFVWSGNLYDLPLIGQHNVLNAMAALTAVEWAMPTASAERMNAALKTFPGVRRRLQRYGIGPVAVYDDYAHNPDKIAALLTTLQERYPRIHILFQPHGYGPLRFHLDDLAQVFSSKLRPGDHVYLLPVYDVGGTTDRSISASDLADKIHSLCVSLFYDREEVIESLTNSVQPGDAVVVAGARDDTLAELAERIDRILNSK